MYSIQFMQYVSDLDFGLSRSLKVKYECAIGLPVYMLSCLRLAYGLIWLLYVI